MIYSMTARMNWLGRAFLLGGVVFMAVMAIALLIALI